MLCSADFIKIKRVTSEYSKQILIATDFLYTVFNFEKNYSWYIYYIQFEVQLKCRISLHQALFTLFSFIWLYSFKLSWTANQIKILLLAPNEFCWCQQLQPFGCPLCLVPPFATPSQAGSSSSNKNLQIEFAVSCQDGWLTQMTSLCSLSQCRWQRAWHCPQSHCPQSHCTMSTVPLC